MKKALITGITGQDGSYLAEFLLSKGYEIYGIVRRTSSINRGRVDHLREGPDRGRVNLIYGDLGDASSLAKIIRTVRPDEIYNLGAQSHVRVSFDVPEYTMDVVAVGVVRLLEALRETGIEAKVYQASSSEMYGKVVETPQTELTPFHPAQSLRGGQGRGPSHCRQLPRKLRDVHLFGDPVQSRVSAPG